jgi:hypothetical protein
MTLSALMSRSCQIVRRSPGSSDRYGNDIPTESLASATCEIQQMDRSEMEEGSVTETLWKVFLPVNTDIQAEDALIVGGVEYEMVGDPWNANSGSSAVHHVEATVRKVAGVEDTS